MAATSFRVRLTLFLGLAVLAVGLPTFYFLVTTYGEQLVTDRRSQLQAHASAAATVLSENLNERRREVELLAQTPLYVTQPLDHPGIRASLDRIQRSYPNYSWIGVTSTDGIVKAATRGHLVGIDVSSRPWFSKARDGLYIGDLHEAVLLSKLLPAEGTDALRFIDFSTPIYDRSGNPKGILGAHVHWRWAREVLTAVIPESTQAHGVEFLIIDRNGKTIYPERLQSGPAAPTLEAVKAKRSSDFHAWGDGGEYLIARQAVKEPPSTGSLEWSVIVRQRKADVLAEVQTLQRASLGVILVAAVILGLTGWIMAHSITEPVRRLSALARQIARGEEKVHFNQSFKALELQRLSEALESMATSLISGKQALQEANEQLEQKVEARTLELQQANEKLESLARTDALTGLPNRMAANERLRDEFARFGRSRQAYAVLVLDVDLFKRINDTRGHAAGDQVLTEVGRRIHRLLRETDFVARMGGEEFLVILPATAHAQALDVAEKIRSTVAGQSMADGIAVTVSIGVDAVQASDVTHDAAISRADTRMYEAKNAGRDRVQG